MNFTQARLKLKRANHHIKEMEARIAALHKTQHARVELDPKTGQEILIHDFNDPAAFDDLALILGDAVHNLNCALDYMWLETITHMAPYLITDRAKFPARGKLSELDGWLKNAHVDTLSPSLYVFMVNRIGPNPGWQAAIWPVHHFDIRDKHRLLIPVLSRGYVEGIEIVDEWGKPWCGSGASADCQRPPYFLRYLAGLHVTKKGKLTAEIMIEDVDLSQDLAIPGMVTGYLQVIHGFVEVFESFLESEGF